MLLVSLAIFFNMILYTHRSELLLVVEYTEIAVNGPPLFLFCSVRIQYLHNLDKQRIYIYKLIHKLHVEQNGCALVY